MLPKIVADLETSLTAKIAVGGTTGTIASNVDDDGVTLADGTYYFTIDGNNSAKEHIRCTKTGTALSSIYSYSRQGVATSGTVREHRVGAKVIMTDYATYKNYFEAAVVTGPGSSTADRVVTFADATGQVLKDSGKLITDLTTGATSSTDNAIARFDSTTGKVIQNSDIIISDQSGSQVNIYPNTAGSNLTIAAAQGTIGNGGNNDCLGGSATSGNFKGGNSGSTGGAGFGSGVGGNSQIVGGQGGATGAGGPAIVQGGAGGATSGKGGDAQIIGGSATAGDSNGGDIYIIAGNKSGSGTVGSIVLKPSTGASYGAFLNTTGIASSNKIFAFPNVTGNIAVATSGAGVPTGTAPVAIGQIYVDTSASKVYISKGTSAGSDWIILN